MYIHCVLLVTTWFLSRRSWHSTLSASATSERVCALAFTIPWYGPLSRIYLLRLRKAENGKFCMRKTKSLCSVHMIIWETLEARSCWQVARDNVFFAMFVSVNKVRWVAATQLMRQQNGVCGAFIYILFFLFFFHSSLWNWNRTKHVILHVNNMQINIILLSLFNKNGMMII